MTELLDVELLSAQPFQIDEAKLSAALQERCGHTEKITSDDSKDFYTYAFADYSVEYNEGSLPAQVMITARFPWSTDTEKLKIIFQQSKFLPNAQQVVQSCQHRIKINDLLARGLPYKERLKLFNGVIQAVLSVVSCDAIYWVTSEQFIQPALYVASQSNPNTLIFGAVNVRMFNISNRQAGECLMDTVGLATLGLPDLQCHFVNLDPNKIAGVLYNTASYIFDKGDVINDGQTVAGLKPDDRWRCHHEESIVAPNREVLDINPGALYNAGRS